MGADQFSLAPMSFPWTMQSFGAGIDEFGTGAGEFGTGVGEFVMGADAGVGRTGIITGHPFHLAGHMMLVRLHS